MNSITPSNDLFGLKSKAFSADSFLKNLNFQKSKIYCLSNDALFRINLIHKNYNKNVVSVGFEPTRIAPMQLECIALTTRPKHHFKILQKFSSKNSNFFINYIIMTRHKKHSSNARPIRSFR